MSKIDFSIILKDIEGKDIEEGPEGAKVPFTLSKAAIQVLFVNEEKDEGEVKMTRFTLAMKIRNAEAPLKLAAEEIVMLKELVGKYMSTLIVGQVWPILDA